MIMGNLEYSDTTVIIPTINEKENISKLMDLIAQSYPGIRIVVSDDGSEDGTREIIAEYSIQNSNIRFIDRSKEAVHGLTASVLHAVKAVNTDFIVVMDGDLQHPPEKVKEILDALREDADLVIGWRDKDLSSKKIHRKVISKIGMILGGWRLASRGIGCKDVLSGYFGIKTKLMREIYESDKGRFEMEGYKVLFDLLKLIDPSTRIREIPFTFSPRGGGVSKMRVKHMLIFAKSLLR